MQFADVVCAISESIKHYLLLPRDADKMQIFITEYNLSYIFS